MNLRKELSDLIDKYKNADSGVYPRHAVRDLLTDIQHYCDENDVDFDYAVYAAGCVYEEEKEMAEKH